MIRLQIAEDEPLARKAMLQSIDFALHGFDVVAVSADGKEAIEHFEKYAPDLVITDINMPYVSGLDVAKHIRESGKSTRVVILTGYDEFEFARQAITYGVSDYLLKPVTAQEMVSFLEKEKEAIEALRKHRDEQAEVQSHAHAAEPVIRNDYLCRLVQGTTQEIEHLERGINIEGFKRAAVALIRVDHFQETAARLNMSWDLLLFAVTNILHELAESAVGCHVFLLPDADCGVLAVSDNQVDLPDRLVRLLSNAVRTLRDTLKIEVTSGMGDLVERFSDIPHSYERAKMALAESAEAKHAIPPIVDKAIRYIDQHYGESGLSLLEMTEHLAVSVSHFTSLFKEHTGKTFVEYLTEVRIEKAKQRLINTDLMLYRVASDVGYDNPTYFASTFKKHVGITPKQFRKLHVRKS